MKVVTALPSRDAAGHLTQNCHSATFMCQYWIFNVLSQRYLHVLIVDTECEVVTSLTSCADTGYLM